MGSVWSPSVLHCAARCLSSSIQTSENSQVGFEVKKNNTKTPKKVPMSQIFQCRHQQAPAMPLPIKTPLPGGKLCFKISNWQHIISFDNDLEEK